MKTEVMTFAPSAQGQKQSDEQLWQFLTTHAALPITLDMSAVSDVTGLQLQLLLSAHKQRGIDGVPMILAGMTETFRQGLTRLGVPEGLFVEGDMQ